MSDTRHETPEPFKVDIPERALIDLDERLRRWRAPVAIADNGSWASGTDPDFLAELVDYWRHGYDWNRPSPRRPTRQPGCRSREHRRTVRLPRTPRRAC
jgi:hypothetical protein